MLHPLVFAPVFYFYLSLPLGPRGGDTLVRVWMVTRKREVETATDLLALGREGGHRKVDPEMDLHGLDPGEEMTEEAEAGQRRDCIPHHLGRAPGWAKSLFCWFLRLPCHSWTLSLATHLVDTILGPAGGRSWKLYRWRNIHPREHCTPSQRLWLSPSSLT